MLGVHVKDDEMVGCSQMEVELEFLGDPKDLDRTGNGTVSWWRPDKRFGNQTVQTVDILCPHCIHFRERFV